MKGTLIFENNNWYVDDGFFMIYPLSPDTHIQNKKDGDQVEFDIDTQSFDKNLNGVSFAKLIAKIKNE